MSKFTNGSGLFLEIILRSDKLRNQGRGELLISLCHQVAFLKKILSETFNSESVGYSDAVVQPGASRITVVVLKARNLPKMDITGLSGDTVQVFVLCKRYIFISWSGFKNIRQNWELYIRDTLLGYFGPFSISSEIHLTSSENYWTF